MILVHRARLAGSAGPLLDIGIAGGRVVAVAPGLKPQDVGPDGSDGTRPVTIDAAGGAVLPGLHDHHIHLRAAAAALESVMAGPPAVNDPPGLARALGAPGRGWLRAVGYHESVAGTLGRADLDRMAPDRPVRVQHRSGALWMLNSRAVEALGLDGVDLAGVEREPDGRPTGRLFRMDAWLARRLSDGPPDLARMSQAAAALGVTGYTEAGPDPSPADVDWLAGRLESGELRQRLHLMSALPGPTAPGGPADRPLDRLRSTGGGRLSLGPVKFLLDDDTLPALEELADRFVRAHRGGLPVAVHCVTRAQLFLTLAALEQAGSRPGDRIEHGAVIPSDTLALLAAFGLAVVTNPSFIRDRGDRYLADVEVDDRPHLYRAGSLLRAGVTLAAGTDAPFGDPDPWASIRVAADRRTRAGRTLGGEERLDPPTALGLFLRDPVSLGATRRIAPGAAADLAVLGCGLEDALESSSAPPVSATIIDGVVVHSS